MKINKKTFKIVVAIVSLVLVIFSVVIYTNVINRPEVQAWILLRSDDPNDAHYAIVKSFQTYTGNELAIRIDKYQNDTRWTEITISSIDNSYKTAIIGDKIRREECLTYDEMKFIRGWDRVLLYDFKLDKQYHATLDEYHRLGLQSPIYKDICSFGN